MSNRNRNDIEDGPLVPKPTVRWVIVNLIRWAGIAVVLTVGGPMLFYSLSVIVAESGGKFLGTIAFYLIFTGPLLAVLVTGAQIKWMKMRRSESDRCGYCGHLLATKNASRCRVCGATQLGYCQECRYDLRGTESGRCPECGTQNAARN